MLVVSTIEWRVGVSPTSVYLLLQSLDLPLTLEHGDRGWRVEGGGVGGGVTYLYLSPPLMPWPSPDASAWWSRVVGGGVGGGCNLPLSISSSRALTFSWRFSMVIEGGGWRCGWRVEVWVEGVTYLYLSPPPMPWHSPDAWAWWSRVEGGGVGGGCNLPLSISSSKALTFPWRFSMVIDCFSFSRSSGSPPSMATPAITKRKWIKPEITWDNRDAAAEVNFLGNIATSHAHCLLALDKYKSFHHQLMFCNRLRFLGSILISLI